MPRVALGHQTRGVRVPNAERSEDMELLGANGRGARQDDRSKIKDKQKEFV